MPTIQLNGAAIHVDDTAPDDRERETIVFSHGLLFDGRQWEPQIAALRERYRIVTYDHRGQGRSEVPMSRCVTIEQCTADAIALIEHLDVGPVHFVGLSMGTFVGLRIAIRRPELLRSLVLLATSADAEPNVKPYRRLNVIARWFGLGIVAGKVMTIIYGRDFMADPARTAERAMWKARLLENKRSIYKAVNGVIERAAVHDQLGSITTPTLILVGEQDTATVPEKAERVHAGIVGSQLQRIPGAGHTVNVEAPDAVNDALLAFLPAHSSQ